MVGVAGCPVGSTSGSLLGGGLCRCRVEHLLGRGVHRKNGDGNRREGVK